MRWLEKMSENIRRSVRSWLQIQPASSYNIQITEMMDFETHAIRNRIWYRGDSNELEQLYGNLLEYADKYKFWASKCTPGMEMRKIHTGLAGLMVRTLTAITLVDMNDFDFDSEKQKQIWSEIEKKSRFRKKMEKALKEILYIGDGAFKVTIDTEVSEYPILEWYPGDLVEIIRKHGRAHEVIFKTPYDIRGQRYVLNERYGYGYVVNELYRGERQVDLNTLEATRDLKDYEFDKNVILAVPIMVYESAKYEGRGGSIFDGKLDNFDALDEVFSQWMDALRAGRARTFVPESYIPKNPETGELMRPNPFDNRFIKGDDNMSEDGKNQINTEQPDIPHESYLASYITALDLCLQGIISPSTLGIDTKKLDNAEAQREKEKTTLYTRNAIVEALQETLPEVVSTAINAYNILVKRPVEKIKVDIPFGEYANPSFESQVETMAKARPGMALMSVEAQVEELYGDSKDDEWKQKEIARLKAEQGIAEVEEPGVSMTAGIFDVNLGGDKDAGKGNEPNIQNEPKGVPGIAAGGQ
ncbi:capsid protein [Clostridiaceae bacterium OM08-6BH]|nr:capsid protein [Clostridiaceae bacterium OM08-6BH]